MISKIRFTVAATAAALSLSAASFAGVTTAELNAVQPIIQLDDSGQYEQAWQALKPLVKANNGRALYLAGCMFRDGHGIPAPDYELALRYFNLSAENGFYCAWEIMGEMHRDGQGVPKDVTKALALFHAAAICGDAGAMVNYGAIHGNGHGVPKNPIEAYAWYTNAAAANNEIARGNMQIIERSSTPEQLAQAKRRADEIKRLIADGRRAWLDRWGEDASSMTITSNNSAIDPNDRTGGLPITFTRDASGTFTVKSAGPSMAEMDIEVGDTLLEIDNKPVAGLSEQEVMTRLAGPVESMIQLRLRHKGANLQIATPREKMQPSPTTQPGR